MTLTELKDFIKSLTSNVMFKYNGKNCGIDPINKTQIDVWYGDDITTLHSTDAVFETPFFDGKTLDEVFDKITNLE